MTLINNVKYKRIMNADILQEQQRYGYVEGSQKQALWTINNNSASRINNSTQFFAVFKKYDLFRKLLEEKQE